MVALASTQCDLDLAQIRGRMYALLAAGWRYPDGDAFGAFSNSTLWLDRPSSFEKLDHATASALSHVIHHLRAIRQLAGDDLECQRESYVALFGHAVRGTCPPYELEYGRSEIIQQASELADVAGFYAAFGMELAGPGSDRQDHLAVECEFLSVLCAKEAVGLESDAPELVDACCDAERAFIKDHLSQWLPAFCSRVLSVEGDGFYGRLAQLAKEFIAGECRRFDISMGPNYLELRPIDPQADSTINCHGTSNECDEGDDRLVPLTINGVQLAQER